MNNITIKRGDDGFGSQLMSIISGIAYAEVKNLNYLHTPISNIKLLGIKEYQNTDLDKCNKLINKIISNLNLKLKTSSDVCDTYPFFHQYIMQHGTDVYYNERFMEKLQNAYPYKTTYPSYYDKNKTNIAIHVRRGSDIFKPDISVRWIDSDIYENVITQLRNRYIDPVFHVFSWKKSNIKNNGDIVFYECNDSSVFVDDFNGLVHSDVLVLGSSSFSWSAGMFNRKKVLCHENFFKLDTPVPKKWKENYNEIKNTEDM